MTMNREAATPPTIVKAEDLLAKMRAGTKDIYEIKLKDLRIPVRVLSMDEMTMVRREGIKQAALVQGDETDKNVFIEKSCLKLASTINGVPLITDKLLSLMSTDEVNYLYDEWVKVMEDVNPSIETIPPEEFRALVEAVKKNAMSSRDCSLRQLRAIFTAFQDLIQRLEIREQQPDNSSGGQS